MDQLAGARRGPLPPAPLRQRVAGTDDAAWFDESGRRSLAEWQRALAVAGCALADFTTIVDFGCGCGRTLRHLLPELVPRQQAIGLDVDAEAIGWLSDSYPQAKPTLLRGEPPAPLPSGGVDLVLSHSVFTHLPEALGLAWLDELARLLRGGGLLLASIHGPHAIAERRAQLRKEQRHDEVGRMDENLRQKGFHHASERLPAEAALPDYYGVSYHDIGYLQRAWLADFTLVAWLPAFALDFQDLVVLRRKSLAAVPAQ